MRFLRHLPRAVHASEREALAILIVALYGFVVALLAPEELVQDSWLTFVSGREVAAGGPPTHDALVVFSQGQAWVDQQWLAQLVYYGLSVLGGIKLAVVFHVAAVTGAFGLAVIAARRTGASPISVFAVGAAAIFLAPWGWQLRAQSLAYVLFAALLWLLSAESRSPSWKLLVAFPLVIVWANVHGSAALGAGLVVLYGLTSAVMEHRAGRRWVLRSVASLAAPLCLLVSPYGLGLVGYYERMLLDDKLAQFVNEWGPTTFSRAWLFFVLAFAAVWLLARHGRLTLFEKLALLATIGAGLSAVRGVVWFALTAVFLMPLLLDGAWPRVAAARNRGRAVAAIGVTSVAALVAVPVVLAVASPSWYEQRWPESAARAVANAADRDPSLHVFATERYADWLLWKDPRLAGRVAFDVRFELYSDVQLERLSAYRHRTGADWKQATVGYRLLVLDRLVDGELERYFLEEPGSRRLYRDETVTVLLRGRNEVEPLSAPLAEASSGQRPSREPSTRGGRAPGR